MRHTIYRTHLSAYDYEQIDELTKLTAKAFRTHQILKPAMNFQEWHHAWISAWFEYPNKMLSPMSMRYREGFFKGDQFNAPHEAIHMMIKWSKQHFSPKEYVELHATINTLTTEGKLKQYTAEQLEKLGIKAGGVGYGQGALDPFDWRHYSVLKGIYHSEKAVLHIIREHIDRFN